MISADVLQLQKRLSALGTAYSRIHAGQQLYRKSEKVLGILDQMIQKDLNTC